MRRITINPMQAADKTNGSTLRWPLPSVLTKADGTPRQVGIEFELQGIEVRELAEIVGSTLGGNVQYENDAEYLVSVPGCAGDYRVEIDSALLKSGAESLAAADDEAPALQETAVGVLNTVSMLVVPCEVVSPPLPMTELAEPMESLVAAIRDAGGEGTQRSPLYAFGVHLNVEPPTLEPQLILNYIRSFVCLYDWIVEAGDVDLMRRVTPYINRFPKDYEERVTNLDYRPDWPTLIADYLASNPTRNRALDMLPMFAHIDERTVRDAVDDDLIKARPAFHYRLANCCIDDPDWSIAQPWSRWLQVEQLAQNPEGLHECCAAFNNDRHRTLSSLDNRWREEVKQWLTTGS